MNKQELIAEMAQITGQSKVKTAETLAAFTDVITNALKEGEKVQLVGFGTFDVKVRAAHTAKNPATGEKVDVAESKAVSFKVGRALKEAVNK